MSDLAGLRAELGSRAADVALMLPALAYTSAEVLAWELRHLYAGILDLPGRLDELLPTGTTQRAAWSGDVGSCSPGPATGPDVREHLPAPRPRAAAGGRRVGPAVGGLPLPRLDLRPGRPCGRARVSARSPASTPPAHGLVELPVTVWAGWVFGHARHPLGHPGVVPFEDHLGELGSVVEPYDPGALALADRHTYEVAANWKVDRGELPRVLPLPADPPELCQVSPPTSGDNYDLPGAWVGGWMDLRDGMATMSLTGESGGDPIPGVSPTPSSTSTCCPTC